jgi:hypothetical protein
MKLNGLHIILTYTCNYECEHCFVWGSPWQKGVFTIPKLKAVLNQAAEAGGIEEVYFEGGEAFLYYPLLLEGVRMASDLGFWTGIVSNGYWATSPEDACLWLQPLAEAGLDSIDMSSDLFHSPQGETSEVQYIRSAAQSLGLDSSVISLDPLEGARAPDGEAAGRPLAGGGVMFRGRAAEKLVQGQPRKNWMSFTHCPYEDLENPARLHVDPLGYLHICQGLVIGNLFEQPLSRLLANYEPHQDPILGTLINGGPTTLALRYLDWNEQGYVDACHLCYTTRATLRERFPEILAPDQMYGVSEQQIAALQFE